MPDASIADVVAARSAGAAQVVDGREIAEFVTGHVPGATSIPMSQLVDRLDEIDPSRPVLVICQSGGRSSAMADVLVHRGFDARSVVGGTAAWIQAGHPVTTGTPDGR